jgi:hypothetical protein
LFQEIEEVLKTDNIVKKVLHEKIPGNRFILKIDRQAIANVLVDALMENLGSWYYFI